MSIGESRNFCLSLKGTGESMPLDNRTLVFSVKERMFCTTDISTCEFANLKCDPDKAIRLRGQHNEVIEGYYMNKRRWDGVKTKGKITDKQFQGWIKDSYDLVVLALPKKIRKGLNGE